MSYSVKFKDSIKDNNSSDYRRCTVTVMDTSDPDITFNEKGECNYVTEYRNVFLKHWDPLGNKKEFKKLISRIKEEGKNMTCKSYEKYL